MEGMKGQIKDMLQVDTTMEQNKTNKTWRYLSNQNYYPELKMLKCLTRT